MLDYIKGSLSYYNEQEAVLENQGLGYKLLISQKTFNKLPQQGSEVMLYISSVIREDSHRHFGFLTRDDRSFFETLIDFSGIGPKTALAILGQYDPHELIELASTSDVTRISKVPGVGKKTAERLIVELKGKNLKVEIPTSISKNSHVQDALSALMQLGFNYTQAQKGVQIVIEERGESVSLSELITLSLQKIRN